MGFLVLDRLVGESLSIGDIRFTLLSVDYDECRPRRENTATVQIGDKQTVLRKEQGYSVNKDVYIVLNDVNPNKIRIAINAPKEIPILRDDARRIVD